MNAKEQAASDHSLKGNRGTRKPELLHSVTFPMRKHKRQLSIRELNLSCALAEQRRLGEEIELSRHRLDNFASQVRTFEATHGAAPDEVLANLSAYEQQLKEQKHETEMREHVAAERRDLLESSLRRWLTALRDFGLAEAVDGTAENVPRRYRMAMRGQGPKLQITASPNCVKTGIELMGGCNRLRLKLTRSMSS